MQGGAANTRRSHRNGATYEAECGAAPSRCLLSVPHRAGWRALAVEFEVDEFASDVPCTYKHHIILCVRVRACVRATPQALSDLHTSAYASIRQHTSAYVRLLASGRRTPQALSDLHTSAYVSIRQAIGKLPYTTSAFIHVCVCVCVCVCVHLCVRGWVCMGVFVCECVCTCISAHACLCVLSPSLLSRLSIYSRYLSRFSLARWLSLSLSLSRLLARASALSLTLSLYVYMYTLYILSLLFVIYIYIYIYIYMYIYISTPYTHLSHFSCFTLCHTNARFSVQGNIQA
jgi:hypothetical protein